MHRPIPFTIKLLYTVFVVLLIPFYVRYYGWWNFLWFSDIALLLTVPALWMEQRLLASMMMLSVFVFDSVWVLDYAVRGVFGFHIIGGSAYMFETDTPLFLRNLSLFHVILPPVLLLLVKRLGYDTRALKYQTMLAWVAIVVSYLFTEPEANINWAFGLGVAMKWQYPKLYLVGLMLAIPTVIYLPMHHILKRTCPVSV